MRPNPHNLVLWASRQATLALLLGGVALGLVKPLRAASPPLQPLPATQQVPAYLAFNGRYATAPTALPWAVHAVVGAGNELQRKPYAWGGGHRYLFDRAYDCSGSLSDMLTRARLLDRPLTSTEFARFGAPGPGRYITIFVKPGEHVFMSVCGLRFDTTGNDQQGPRWRPTPRAAQGFIIRHPWGL